MSIRAGTGCGGLRKGEVIWGNPNVGGGPSSLQEQAGPGAVWVCSTCGGILGRWGFRGGLFSVRPILSAAWGPGLGCPWQCGLSLIPPAPTRLSTVERMAGPLGLAPTPPPRPALVSGIPWVTMPLWSGQARGQVSAPPPVPLPPAAGSGSGQGLGSPGPCTSRLPTPCHTHTVISLIFVFQPRFSRLRSVIGEGNTLFLQGKRSLQGPEDRPESVPSLPSPKAPPPQRVCEHSRVPEGRPSRPVSRPRGLTPSHPHPGRADRASGHAIPPLEAAGLGLHLRIPPRARARPAPRPPCQATGDWLGPASTEHSPGGAPLRPRGHVRRPWGGGSGAAHRRPARCE